MDDSMVEDIIAGRATWQDAVPPPQVPIGLPDKWWRDEMIRDEVQMRIRGLIREGYRNHEIEERLGVNGNTVQKQRVRMRTARGRGAR